MESTAVSMNRLYGDLAHLWPLLSPAEDYTREARDWVDAIREYHGDGRHHILELGVGGGSLLSHLTGEFDADAVDCSEAMLEVAAEVNPDVTFHQGDMRTVRLDRTFDAVIIHDAIDYMISEPDLAAVFDTAAAHLASGGLFICSPDHTRETFHDPQVYTSTKTDGITELTFVQYDYDPDPDDTEIESLMTYFIRTDESLTIEHDRHVTGLFSRKTWHRLLEHAGFRVYERPCVNIEEPGHILFCGRRI